MKAPGAPTRRNVNLAPRVDRLVDDFALIPFARSASFASDGSRLAFVSNREGTPQLWVMAAGGGRAQRLTTSAPVLKAKWSPIADQIAIEVSADGGSTTDVLVMSLPGCSADAVAVPRPVSSLRLAGWTADGWLLLSARHDGSAHFDGLVISPEGAVVFAVQGDTVATVHAIESRAQAGWWAAVEQKRTRSHHDLEMIATDTGQKWRLASDASVVVGGFFETPSRFVFGANAGTDRVALMAAILDNDDWTTTVIAIRDDAELEAVAPVQDGLAVIWNCAGISAIEVVDVNGRVLRSADIPLSVVSDVSASPSRRALAVSMASPTTTTDVWLFNGSNDTQLQGRRLTNSLPRALASRDLVAPTPVAFVSEDGLPLSGWLYQPPHAVRAAVIVFHGGPESQERPRLLPTYQALVSIGIAVFAPNVRGSSGFGKHFASLDDRERRFDVLGDVRAAHSLVVERTAVDGQCVGVMGASYGGYLTLMALAHVGDAFGAGVALFPITDLPGFFSTTDPTMAASSTLEYGDPSVDSTLLERLSPLAAADSIRAPLLLMHGRLDRNVPVEQTLALANALQRAHAPVEVHIFDEEGHGFAAADVRREAVLRAVDFFNRNLIVGNDSVEAEQGVD